MVVPRTFGGSGVTAGVTVECSSVPRMSERLYWERHARGYDASLRVLARPLPRMLQLTVEAVRGAPRVLEVASGTGLVTMAVAPHVEELVATDYAASMTALTAQRARAAKLHNVRCATADVMALPYADHEFDAVIAANVFHLLLDLYGALRALKRVLRPGGRLVCPTFCHDETLLARAASRVVALTGFPGKVRYSSRSLRETLRICGVRVVRTETIAGVIPICFVEAMFF